MFVSYETLSRNERRAAKKLAKKLLRSVQPVKDSFRITSVRGALNTAFMKPENVEGVLIYDDGEGNWWGDAVLRKGSGTIQWGTCTDAPRKSYQEALGDAKNLIAGIKFGIDEEPIVQKIRAMGADPAEVEFLRVSRPDFGCRWIPFLSQTGVAEAADTFVASFAKSTIPMEDMARTFIFLVTDELLHDPVWLLTPDDFTERGETAELAYCAGAYLVQNGILNFDAKDIDHVPICVAYEGEDFRPVTPAAEMGLRELSSAT